MNVSNLFYAPRKGEIGGGEEYRDDIEKNLSEMYSCFESVNTKEEAAIETRSNEESSTNSSPTLASSVFSSVDAAGGFLIGASNIFEVPTDPKDELPMTESSSDAHSVGKLCSQSNSEATAGAFFEEQV